MSNKELRIKAGEIAYTLKHAGLAPDEIGYVLGQAGRILANGDFGRIFEISDYAVSEFMDELAKREPRELREYTKSDELLRGFERPGAKFEMDEKNGLDDFVRPERKDDRL